MSRVTTSWLWPAIIVLSALAAGFVTFMGQDAAVRPIIVTWFLFICPGMTIVCFLRPGELAAQWTLAIALSCAIDGMVSGIALYTGKWSPTGIVIIVMVLSLGGSIARIMTLQARSKLIC